MHNGKETIPKSVAIANPKKNAPFALSCQVSGTTLALKIDGVVKASVVDTALPSGGVGLAISSTAGTGASQGRQLQRSGAVARSSGGSVAPPGEPLEAPPTAG